MPTIVTKSIGTAGRDYSTIQAWEDACPADLVAVDQIWKGELYNDSEFIPSGGTITIGGQTTDATRYAWLTTAAGQGRKDSSTKATDKWNYDQTKGVGIQFNTGFNVVHFSVASAYAVVDGLQFYINYGSGQNPVAVSGANATVKNCIVYRPATGNGVGGYNATVTTAKFINCVMIDGAGSDSSGFQTDGGGTFINCTAFKSAGTSTRRAFTNQYANPVIIGCLGIGYSAFTRPGISLGTGSDYNATSNSSVEAGTHNIVNLVAANVFVSAVDGVTSDVRIKAGASVINAGQRQASYTSDLDAFGTARSTTTPTIGANEYASGGGGGPTYTMVAATGAVALTGSAATLRAARKLVVGAVSFALTGNAAAFKAARKLLVSSASFTVTGNAANLQAARKLVAGSGSFALAGSAATLRAARKLPVASAAFTVAGSAATLTYTPKPVAGAYVLVCSPAAFTVTAQPVLLKASRKMVVAPAAVTVTANPVALAVARKLVVAAAAIIVTVAAATLRRARRLTVATGTVTVTGNPATLTYTPVVGPPVVPPPLEVPAGPLAVSYLLVVPAENRMYVVPAENRMYAVSGEQRGISL